METYATWVRLFELMPYYSWIVDRFHLSTQVFQASQGRFYDFRWLEERLLPLRFAVISCRRSPESFVKAREERLKVSGNPGQYDDLGVFIREQEAFTRRCRRAASRGWNSMSPTAISRASATRSPTGSKPRICSACPDPLPRPRGRPTTP